MWQSRLPNVDWLLPFYSMRALLTKKRYIKAHKKPRLKSHQKAHWANRLNELDILQGNHRQWLSVKYYGHDPKECTFHIELSIS